MNEDYEFDFAISFAGPQREVAAQLANALSEHRFRVFYDASYRSRLLGRKLDHEFKWIFGPGTLFFVPLVSQDYVDRSWPQFEWSIGKLEAERRDREFILPLRIDDSLLLGLSDSIGYLDLREHSINEIVAILAEKAQSAGVAPRILQSQTWVATFGLHMDDLHESKLLPPDAPSQYFQLCDWLEHDLIDRLESVGIQDLRLPEESSRNGETLSVRIAFEWSADRGPLEFGDLAWWNVLEVQPFDVIYGTEIVE